MSLPNLKTFEVWFVTGSQHLYGEETLKQVATHSQTIAKALDASPQIPVKIVFKPTVKTLKKYMAFARKPMQKQIVLGS